ncbi:PAS domain S-box protein [Vreelandella rituensis]|uniref:PAS domain S-box protein n=1 Tax=Vreelandella rituensis TaxID=2282306 RepID=UPI0039EF6607
MTAYRRIKSCLPSARGLLVTVEMHRHAIRSDDSMVIVGVLRDITERKRSEQRHYLLSR